jgi:hypothetical protein
MSFDDLQKVIDDSPAIGQTANVALPDSLFRSESPRTHAASATPLFPGGESNSYRSPGPMYPTDNDSVTPLPALPSHDYSDQDEAKPRSKWPFILAIIVLAVVLAVVISLNLVGTSSEPSERGSVEVPTPTSTQTTSEPKPSSEPTETRQTNVNNVVFPPSGVSQNCSETLAVGANTTCEFAENVEQAIPGNAKGDFTVTAHSPVTNLDYNLTCSTANVVYTCTTTTGAVIYVKADA